MTNPHDQDDDLLAAEYVLGLLDADDWRAAHERAALDGGFAARVRDWEIRLDGLNTDFPEMPAPDLLPQIEARLFPAPVQPPRGAGLWRWLGAGSMVAALAIGLAVLSPVLRAPQAPLLTAELVAEDRALVLAASFDGTQLRLQADGPEAGDGQDYELWVIGADGVPASLGLLRGGLFETQAALEAGQVLAVSLEPAGGSDTGLPTGPVLATAELRES
ncbi:anti-sigma factor [Roseibaca sp. Y0-43]|uniref:anti-sigma factor n=1 Tax=Roseibaca sp. Y0-43 TaxID=2816854 RepID=UPI001D0C33D8|nr:anti-sigma factor [Roseibaca sp. Y0-43]MCC1481788.1 anti-sigma factor [Roseibaca sp. Y0-43]